jgi:hypothetical protein
MATDKKSFLLYCDLIHTVSKMPNDKAGELFKHILQYVNNENPITDDLIIQLTFEPIKQSLKRDLQKYENIRLKNIENANKRWNKENATAYDRKPNYAKNAVSDSDSVSDSVSGNDSVSVSDILLKKETKEYKPTFEDFKIYALEKEPTVSLSALKNKYDAWEANDWKNGNDKPIKNWKSALLQTMPYIEKIKKVAPDGYYYDKQGILKRRIS